LDARHGIKCLPTQVVVHKYKKPRFQTKTPKASFLAMMCLPHKNAGTKQHMAVMGRQTFILAPYIGLPQTHISHRGLFDASTARKTQHCTSQFI